MATPAFRFATYNTIRSNPPSDYREVFRKHSAEERDLMAEIFEATFKIGLAMIANRDRIVPVMLPARGVVEQRFVSPYIPQGVLKFFWSPDHARFVKKHVPSYPVGSEWTTPAEVVAWLFACYMTSGEVDPFRSVKYENFSEGLAFEDTRALDLYAILRVEMPSVLKRMKEDFHQLAHTIG